MSVIFFCIFELEKAQIWHVYFFLDLFIKNIIPSEKWVLPNRDTLGMDSNQITVFHQTGNIFLWSDLWI